MAFCTVTLALIHTEESPYEMAKEFLMVALKEVLPESNIKKKKKKKKFGEEKTRKKYITQKDVYS